MEYCFRLVFDLHPFLVMLTFLLLFLLSTLNTAKAGVFSPDYERWPQEARLENGISYKIIHFPSQTGENVPEIARNRTAIRAVQWLPASSSKGIVFYLYGGSCLSVNAHDFEVYPIMKDLLDSGFEVIYLDYKDGYNVRLGHIDFPNSKKPEFCELAARDQVREINNAIIFFNNKLNKDGKSLFVFGHSYGGYLVNHLMTSELNPGVAGYISSHGVWDVNQLPFQNYNELVPPNYNPISNQRNFNAPSLIFHSTNDPQTDRSGLPAFKSWSGNELSSSSFELVTFEGEYHSINSVYNNNPSFKAHFLNFLKFNK